MPEGRLLFQQHWWLDAVAPGTWRETVVGPAERPDAQVSWVQQRSRTGLVRLAIPPLTRSGPWLSPSAGGSAAVLAREKKLMTALIDGLPQHDLCQLVLPPGQGNWLPFHWAGFTAAPRVTYRLEDVSSTEQLWSALTDKTRNAVRKGQTQVEVRTEGPPEALVALVTASLTRQHARDLSPDLVRRIHDAVLARGAGAALYAFREGRPVAAALVVWDDSCAYYLLAGANDTGRALAAQSALLWEAIQLASAKARHFDFEGTMLEAVEPVFRGFGGRQAPYLVLEHTSRRYSALRAVRDLGAVVRP